MKNIIGWVLEHQETGFFYAGFDSYFDRQMLSVNETHGAGPFEEKILNLGFTPIWNSIKVLNEGTAAFLEKAQPGIWKAKPVYLD